MPTTLKADARNRETFSYLRDFQRAQRHLRREIIF